MTQGNVTMRTAHVIQGLYLRRDHPEPQWLDWLRDEMTLKQAKAAKKNFDRIIAEPALKNDPYRPTASRIVLRTTTDEVLL